MSVAGSPPMARIGHEELGRAVPVSLRRPYMRIVRRHQIWRAAAASSVPLARCHGAPFQLACMNYLELQAAADGVGAEQADQIVGARHRLVLDGQKDVADLEAGAVGGGAPAA